MPDAAFKIERLRKRPDFLACAKAAHCARGAVLVQARPRDEAPLVRAGAWPMTFSVDVVSFMTVPQ